MKRNLPSTGETLISGKPAALMSWMAQASAVSSVANKPEIKPSTALKISVSVMPKLLRRRRGNGFHGGALPISI